MTPINAGYEFINSSDVDINQYTALKASIFLKPVPNGTILPSRRGISAVLLISVHGDKSVAWGILHPDRTVRFHCSLRRFASDGYTGLAS